jgi:hypothetical protein
MHLFSWGGCSTVQLLQLKTASSISNITKTKIKIKLLGGVITEQSEFLKALKEMTFRRRI